MLRVLTWEVWIWLQKVGISIALPAKAVKSDFFWIPAVILCCWPTVFSWGSWPPKPSQTIQNQQALDEFWIVLESSGPTGLWSVELCSAAAIWRCGIYLRAVEGAIQEPTCRLDTLGSALIKVGWKIISCRWFNCWKQPLLTYHQFVRGCIFQDFDRCCYIINCDLKDCSNSDSVGKTACMPLMNHFAKELAAYLIARRAMSLRPEQRLQSLCPLLRFCIGIFIEAVYDMFCHVSIGVTCIQWDNIADQCNWALSPRWCGEVHSWIHSHTETKLDRSLHTPQYEFSEQQPHISTELSEPTVPCKISTNFLATSLN